MWHDVRGRAGLSGAARFRFHDLRHDLASKVLCDTGSLKLTAKLLDDASTATVDKTYAHVARSDTAAARLQSRSKNARTSLRTGKLKAV